jgi:NAD(P)-dependent dehydrogenase (short-subunit alcohol dehydrogenase family)
VSEPKVVLITGCSSGIGREAARRFAASGYRVYATMRRLDDGAALRAESAERGWALSTLALDVTSGASVDAAVGTVLDETRGRIDVLVNNAGFYMQGPLEETTADELRAQFETNVIGVHRVTRAVLPAMRARGDGAVVMVSSISGRVAIPVAGAYHASKWALEALGETLRYELRPFGIRVTLVEPGPFRTALHDKELRAAASRREDSPYRDLVRAYQKKSDAMRRPAPDGVVDVIVRAATHPNPRLRWRVGPTSFSGGVLRQLTPDALYELVLGIAFRWRARRRALPG